MTHPEAVIETERLTKYYGPRRGVEDVTLAVGRGEIFGFLGPNGAGKTTTIRCLLGFVRPSRGSVRVFGMPPGAIDRSRIGVIPGELTLFERMTGGGLLDYLGRLSGRPAVRRGELLERFALEARDLARPVRHYSRGMKQKLGILQALQHDPDVLILDEPTEGLDPLMQQEFYALLGEARSRGRTVFLSSHLLWEVERICDRVGIIRAGRLAAVEQVEDLRGRALRRIEVEFADEAGRAAFEPPPGVVLERAEGRRATVRAPAAEIEALLRTLLSHRVRDVVIERPSLEEAFLDYYREGAGGR